MAEPEKPKPFGEIVREATELIWPRLKGRAIKKYKVSSKPLKGRTKLSIHVEVWPK